MAERDPALPISRLPTDSAADPVHARLRQDLARAVAALCPPALAADRDDLVQNAMLKVMAVRARETADAGSGEGKPTLSSSYLYRVAHSALVDAIRTRRRRPEVELDMDDDSTTPAAHGPLPDAVARGREIGVGIRDCLGRLGDDRRLAVTLHLLGHSVPDAARLMRWAAKRTENLVYRGLADLRACLERKGLAP